MGGRESKERMTEVRKGMKGVWKELKEIMKGMKGGKR
jgi:hypothetical protein